MNLLTDAGMNFEIIEQCNDFISKAFQSYILYNRVTCILIETLFWHLLCIFELVSRRRLGLFCFKRDVEFLIEKNQLPEFISPGQISTKLGHRGNRAQTGTVLAKLRQLEPFDLPRKGINQRKNHRGLSIFSSHI